MKSEDLMPGDWVNYRNTDDGHAPYLEPIRITKDDFVLDEATFFNAHLEPIPLTPEILEKNGFKKEGSWFNTEDDYYDVSIREITDNIWRVKYCDTEFSVIHIEFVHELQHALRLWRTGKTIEL